MERKLLSSLLCFLLCITVVQAQILEDFETEPLNQQFFTSNSQVFNITTQAGGTFQIYSVGPGFGWNGTGADDRYIDNFTTKQNNVPFVVTISSAGSVPFVLKSFYGYLSDYQDHLNVTGSLTVVGKLGGVTQFTATSSTGFVTTLGFQNGFTFINMATYGGSNNSNKAIDQLVFTSTNNYHYIAIDAFKWAPAFTVSSSMTSPSCNGGSNGTATVTPSGGTSPYTYSWAPSGGTAATASGLAAGSYTCTVTDAAAVTYAKTVVVTQPSAISSSISSQTNIACNGGSTGAATLTVSGGTGSKTYSWAPSGGTGATASGLVAGTYTVTITDANSCSITKTVIITEPDVLVANIYAHTNIPCNGGATGSAAVAVWGGTSPYTYEWSPSGGTAAMASGLEIGTYTATVTDAKSCVTTQTVSITQPTAIKATTSQVDVTCNGASNGSATVIATGGTGAFSYSWTPSGGTAATASGLAQGSYTVTIKDANNCSITKSFTITEPTVLTATTSQTNVRCNSSATAFASVTVTGGTSPYQYSWAPSGGTGATASGLIAGTYTVTITDANNCILTKTFIITEPTALNAITTRTNVSCNGGANGSATVTVTGGTGAYTYQWAPSGGNAATATGLISGTYTLTITDANNCMLTKTITIIQPNAIAATTAQTNVSCKGGSNGSATVTATGGTGILSYAWTPSGGTAATATGLVAGSYTVTIIDANTCSITKTVTITEPDALSTSATHTNVSCNGGSNGSATVTTSGGTNPYTYAWAPAGGSAATATGLNAGTYTCTITDANMCKTMQSVSITEPPVLTASGTKTDILCHGSATGIASVTVTGGTNPYTYTWAPAGGSTATATGLIAGTYTCTITDANNCKYEEKLIITEPTELMLTFTQKNVGCNGGADGSATAMVTGGFGAYSYSWAPSGGTAATASGLSAGTYTVTVTDGYSCVKIDTVSITQPAVLSANLTKTNVHCHGDSSGVAIVIPIGGTAPYTYAWNAPYVNKDSTLIGLPAGTFTCTVTDAHNCTYDAKVIITEPAVLTASITHSNVSCFGGANGTATITASGGTAPFTFAWTPSGGTASTASGLKAGTYACSVKDTAGCMTIQTVTITEPVKLFVTGNASPIACHGQTAIVNIFATGGTTPYTGTGTFTSPGGIHTFVVSDNNSCADSIQLDIKEPLAIKGSQSKYICAGDKLVVGDSTYTVSGTYVNVLKTANSCDSTLTTYLTVNTINTTVTVSTGVITSNAINSTYQWIDCMNGNVIIPTATGQSYNVVKSGDYAVIVTTESCSDTSACTHVVATGIDPYIIADQLSVYPNPSTGTFTIHTTLAGTYTIINELGQTVRSFQLNSANNYSVMVSELSNGTYYIIGINKNQLIRQKIVVVQYQ